MHDESGKGAADGSSAGGGTAAVAQNSSHLNGHTVSPNGYNPAITPTPPQQSDTRVSSPVPSPAAIVPRDQWGGKYEFLLSCIGYCVGLGNVWRFPYLCYRNGGGVFLIPYFIMLFVTGVPLFLMELSLGQYGSAGPIMVWKCCPLLKGIGIGMLCVSTLVCLYYNVIIAWTFYYLGSSFQSPLPWSCDAVANVAICANRTVGNSSSERPRSPTEIFWNEKVLGVVNSEGLHDPGPVRWPLALCLLAAWIIIFLCMLKGIRSSGKVVYVTATFPYFVLIVLIIRGATLEGSLQGVAFYLTPDWSRLANAQVWNDAASQIFYSLGIGVGGLLSMASYNKFDNNVIRDTIVITIGNCGTSFFAGFAIFSILGHMAWRKGVPVGEVADRGPGLAFVAYPEALALLPGSVFWSIMFFLMLFMLGVDTLFGNMEGITTAVLDEFPNLRRNAFHKSLFLGALCFAFYLMGLLLVTDGGIYWFTLIDSFSTSFGLIIITLFMCIGISFFYGVNQFCQDIIDMICHCPPWCSKVLIYFKACWVFCTPFLLLFILIYIFLEMYNTPLHYGSYVYPRWGKGLGVCMGATCCLQILIWAVVAISKETGSLKEIEMKPRRKFKLEDSLAPPASSNRRVPPIVADLSTPDQATSCPITDQGPDEKDLHPRHLPLSSRAQPVQSHASAPQPVISPDPLSRLFVLPPLKFVTKAACSAPSYPQTLLSWKKNSFRTGLIHPKQLRPPLSRLTGIHRPLLPRHPLHGPSLASGHKIPLSSSPGHLLRLRPWPARQARHSFTHFRIAAVSPVIAPPFGFPTLCPSRAFGVRRSLTSLIHVLQR